jgi:hypothetical protein
LQPRHYSDAGHRIEPSRRVEMVSYLCLLIMALTLMQEMFAKTPSICPSCVHGVCEKLARWLEGVCLEGGERNGFK